VANRIYQYDLDGNYIREWNNQKEFKQATGLNVTIYDCNAHPRCYYNQWCFFYKRDDVYNKEICLNIKRGRNGDAVVQKTLEGDIIKVWPSIDEAYKDTGIKKVYIYKCCHSHYMNKTAGGFIWEFV
jgi:hypothetical protein